MHRIIISIAAVLYGFVAFAQSVEQTFYIDFGEKNVSSRGNLTTGADTNGHYWTNVYSSPSERLYPTDWTLTNSDNQETSYKLQVLTYFHTNGMSGGGGLQNPQKALLDDLAVATATQDYMHVETTQDYNAIRFVGLDPDKAYRFTCLGSRVVAEVRGGTFEFHGENSWSDYMQMSGPGIGANGYDGNNNKPMVTVPIFPTRQGTITMVFNKRYKSGMIYLNCMKIEELSGLERPNKELSLSQKFFIDFGETANDSRGHQTTGADKNGNYWNNFSSGQASSNEIPAKSITLVNTEKTRTKVKMTSSATMYTNGVTNGGLNNPTDENLGELAIQTATEDYIWIDNNNKYTLTFSGLDKEKCYRFSVFGSRSTNEGDRRFSEYQFSGQTSFFTGVATSGQYCGGANYHGNVRNIAESDYLYPDADGVITFTVNRTQTPASGFAHFNLIRIEEYEGGVRPDDPLALTSPVLVGDATEHGGEVALNELKPGGQSKGVYEVYQRLHPGTFVLSGIFQGETVTLGLDADGNLVENGSPVTITEEQVARIRYDARNATLTVTPVELYLRGNIVAGGTKVAYKGDGVFEQEVDMTYGTVFLFSDKYFYFTFNNDDNLAVKRLSGSRTAVGMPSEGFSGENIRINGGTYTMTLDMNNYVWDVSAPIDEYKISAFGSSVCNGQGADGNKGYAYLYGQQCETRNKRNQSEYPFHVSGVSIGGNTTNDLLNRYDEMIHDFGKYVIIGLSMGNEGIHGASNPDAIYNQFRDNMLLLIDKMKQDGKTVVVMNNYTRGDYNSTDYNYIKNMNRLIHQWDVASVNTLGAIDNGEGKWADGYMADNAHPTTSGHSQFFRAIPPSLFDALEKGKPQPVRDSSQSTTLENGSVITFKGETNVNPYTVTVRVKGSEAGQVIAFTSGSSKKGTVSILDGGYVEYVATNKETVTSSQPLIKNDDTWYDITLTGYYAQKRTLVYVNHTLVGEVNEGVTPGEFTIGDPEKALHRQFSELTFWRSAMNALEINDHCTGKMMKSSLDIYSPLSDAIKTDGVVNLAQTLNEAQYVEGSVVDGISSLEQDSAVGRIYDVQGRMVENTSQPGLYIANGKKILKK